MQQFWNAYGLKRDRYAAERVWKRMSDKTRRAAFAGIAAYREACERQGIAMMYGQGYLSHRRWEDEAPPQPSPVREGAESLPSLDGMGEW